MHQNINPDRIKLLLVDDSDEFRHLVMAYLKSFPFDITEADDGSVALELMKEQSFDVVLMDIRMPLMDGLTTTRLFREWEEKVGKKHLLIIALTAFSLPHERQDTLNAGCDEFLTKPIRRADLLDAMKSFLELRY